MTSAIKERFVDNWQGFLKAHRWILIVFVLALLADGLSTIHFMLQTGPEEEMHPAVNIAARILGPILGPMVGVAGKAIAGLIVAVYWRRIGWIILLLVSIISVWAAWYNMWGWQYYQPGILKWWPV